MMPRMCSSSSRVGADCRFVLSAYEAVSAYRERSAATYLAHEEREQCLETQHLHKSLATVRARLSLQGEVEHFESAQTRKKLLSMPSVPGLLCDTYLRMMSISSTPSALKNSCLPRDVDSREQRQSKVFSMNSCSSPSLGSVLRYCWKCELGSVR